MVALMGSRLFLVRNDVYTCRGGLEAKGTGELDGWITITSLVTLNDELSIVIYSFLVMMCFNLVRCRIA